ncbi:hypothetical protein ACQVBX_07825 [Dyella sp. KULCS107]|uniref:hypothetical protein n=1 Tax=Dyella sp. KULCS107 TaxID=3422216 RepID=UPI003D6F01C6
MRLAKYSEQDGLGLAKGYTIKGFRAPSAPESLSLGSPRESNQREGDPPRRLPGCARQVREPRPGFSTGLLPWRKGIGIHADAPAGLSSTAHRLTREVEIKSKIKSHGNSSSNSNSNNNTDNNAKAMVIA